MNRKCKCCGKKYDKPKTTLKTLADDICYDCFTIWTNVNAIMGLETTLTPDSEDETELEAAAVTEEDLDEEEHENVMPVLFDWRMFKNFAN